MKLSVSITAFNGMPLVRKCVQSVQWADEIIVVDSGSTDATREVCRELGAQVTQTPDFPGYGPQKNRALDRTTGDWVLALDHDEWVSPELRAEIEATIKNPGDAVAFTMPRSSNFCGQHGGVSVRDVGDQRAEPDAASDRGQGAEVRAAFEHRSVATTKHRTVEVVEHPERAVALGLGA